MVTCAQKKGSNDIHEKQVEDEDKDEDDKYCQKRSHVSKKKVQTITMKNWLRMRTRMKMMTRIVQKGHMRAIKTFIRYS